MELGGGGESSTKRARLSSDDAAAAGEDRLSALPNDVHVLLKLTTRAAARTSVLARSWRRVWALLPTLSFDETADPGRLRDALDGHEVPVRSLLVGANGAAAESLGAWLPAAARRVSGDLSLYSYVRVSEEEEDDEAPQRGVFVLPCFDKAT
ncbi:putative F-box/FBD/LRR-repeat protein At3g49030 isoform X3 [Panicum virgatum]|uniref:putative F-box/FBD/LRR-repeat protein At3g49030 isoform X3 n=1 Tax=Panicum virgatum TaxID=38727 RepID=UPI0019D5D960|nr:putative F-box/FBD/LRR-repeat protein At3g49030 isoform X3 [Panicum virgatum]